MTERQTQFLGRVMEVLNQAGVSTPGEIELARELGVPPQAVKEIVRLGVEAENLLVLKGGVLYGRAQLEELMARISEFAGDRPIVMPELRAFLGCSRKYADALIDYTDLIGFTERTEAGRFVRR